MPQPKKGHLDLLTILFAQALFQAIIHKFHDAADKLERSILAVQIPQCRAGISANMYIYIYDMCV